MGILGWQALEFDEGTVLQNGEDIVLKGKIVEYYTQYGFLQDGDWNLKVVPDKEFDFLCTNSEGIVNEEVYASDKKKRIIEGEVYPCETFNTLDYANQFLKPLVGKQVTMTGSFVEDVSHHHKTEIHPITSIICEEQKVGYKNLTILVLADASYNAKLPKSGESKIFKMDIPFENTPSLKNKRKLGKCQLIGTEYNHSESLRPFKVILKNDYSHLSISIETGEPKFGKGFYYAKVKLYF